MHDKDHVKEALLCLMDAIKDHLSTGGYLEPGTRYLEMFSFLCKLMRSSPGYHPRYEQDMIKLVSLLSVMTLHFTLLNRHNIIPPHDTPLRDDATRRDHHVQTRLVT